MVETTASFEPISIGENSYRIENNGVRCFLFAGSKKALLVDTGFGGSLKSVVETLTDKPIMLVNSHADPDHIGANAEFDTVFMHPLEIEHYGKDAQPLNEGDIIDLGGKIFEVIHIPGHTPGSIALLDRENRFIITGDTVSDGPVFMFGETRSLETYMESLEKLISMAENFDTVYPSHGTFPLPPSQLSVNLEGAKKLSAGLLSAEEPPFPIPAKLYKHNGAAFFY